MSRDEDEEERVDNVEELDEEEDLLRSLKKKVKVSTGNELKDSKLEFLTTH